MSYIADDRVQQSLYKSGSLSMLSSLHIGSVCPLNLELDIVRIALFWSLKMRSL